MSRSLQISLPPSAPGLRNGLTMPFSKALCFEFMQDALQAPVRLDCGPDVGSVRQCFYRARQHCQARGVHRFDGLKFQVKGSTLVIKRRPFPSSSQFRHKRGEIARVRSSEEKEK